MRVVLEIVSGPMRGRKTVLIANDSVSVGRSDWAQLVCAQDERMSRVHFVVKSDEVACYLADHSSRNGTFVNGVRITECMLRDGDRIYAGVTDFCVQIEGDSPDQARSMGGNSWVPQDLDSAVQKSAQQRLNIPYTAVTCDSGLSLYRGAVADLVPVKLALVLRLMYPLHLIVDLNRLGMPFPEQLGEPQYLFGWLDRAAAAAASPVFISPAAENDAWKSLLDQGWGKDAVVCLFSNTPSADLLAHLQEACQARAGGGTGMIGYCWPGILAPLLLHSSSKQVSRFMSSIEAVLVEFRDLPESWQLFGDPLLAQTLNTFGFRPQVPGAATTSR
ncbi:MAG TPA: FHA domain-containing protein [Planctomycetaceae bacterium]|jgi:hypothetical protein